jgi:hypothetical protein
MEQKEIDLEMQASGRQINVLFVYLMFSFHFFLRVSFCAKPVVPNLVQLI